MWLKRLWKRTKNSSRSGDIELKKIAYRGGIIDFSIPRTWIEEYGDEGGGVFYEDAEDSGTLRVNVMTFASNRNSEAIDVDVEAKTKAKENNGVAIILDDGNALVKYEKDALENGENLKITFWEVYNPVPQNHLRIAVFSYTLLSSQFDLPNFQQELELLDREIANVRFATQLGEMG